MAFPPFFMRFFPSPWPSPPGRGESGSSDGGRERDWPALGWRRGICADTIGNPLSLAFSRRERGKWKLWWEIAGDGRSTCFGLEQAIWPRMTDIPSPLRGEG